MGQTCGGGPTCSASSLADEEGFVSSTLSMYFLPLDVTMGTDFVEGFGNKGAMEMPPQCLSPNGWRIMS